jgi:hypothetical protein
MINKTAGFVKYFFSGIDIAVSKYSTKKVFDKSSSFINHLSEYS